MRGSLSVIPLPSGRGSVLFEFDGAIVGRISPAVVGDERRPAGTTGVLIIRISAEALVELVVLGEFVAVESDAEARTIGHSDGAAFIFHEAAFDDVVGEVMVVGVGGKGQVRNDGAQMQHGRKLNAELAG